MIFQPLFQLTNIDFVRIHEIIGIGQFTLQYFEFFRQSTSQYQQVSYLEISQFCNCSFGMKKRVIDLPTNPSVDGPWPNKWIINQRLLGFLEVYQIIFPIIIIVSTYPIFVGFTLHVAWKAVLGLLFSQFIRGFGPTTLNCDGQSRELEKKERIWRKNIHGGGGVGVGGAADSHMTLPLSFLPHILRVYF